jgi:hypothetical protein
MLLSTPNLHITDTINKYMYSPGVTKRCRLSCYGWPIAPSCMSPNAVWKRGCGVSANEYSCAHGAQIKFGNLTPYLCVQFENVWYKYDLTSYFKQSMWPDVNRIVSFWLQNTVCHDAKTVSFYMVWGIVKFLPVSVKYMSNMYIRGVCTCSARICEGYTELSYHYNLYYCCISNKTYWISLWAHCRKKQKDI